MRGRRECVGVCTHACEWVGRGGEGVVWCGVAWRGGGITELEKLKRQKGVCHVP